MDYEWKSQEKIDLLRRLEKEGAVRENCPEPHYWRFDVLKPDELHQSLVKEYDELGEIHW